MVLLTNTQNISLQYLVFVKYCSWLRTTKFFNSNILTCRIYYEDEINVQITDWGMLKGWIISQQICEVGTCIESGVVVENN